MLLGSGGEVVVAGDTVISRIDAVVEGLNGEVTAVLRISEALM